MRHQGRADGKCLAAQCGGGGIALRWVDTVWCLYLGTWVIGSGIAIGNVLLPSLVKRYFPDRIAVLSAETHHEDGRLLATAIGSFSIFPPRSAPRSP